MSTNSISNNNFIEDRYKFYNYSNECIETGESTLKAETVQYQNRKEIHNDSIKSHTNKIDHLSPSTKSRDINEKALNLAKSISNQTKLFKEKYYDDAYDLKDQNQKHPNIKNYLQVANKLKETGLEVDQLFIKANSTDCSGFIKMIYEESGKPLQPKIEEEEKKLKSTYGAGSERFKELDRGAELLRRGSSYVNPEDVKPGDLIFFKDVKTSSKVERKDSSSNLSLTDYATHVGIVSKVTYDKNGDKSIFFIHKSTNGGVVESSLNSNARTNNKITYSDLNPTFGRIE